MKESVGTSVTPLNVPTSADHGRTTKWGIGEQRCCPPAAKNRTSRPASGKTHPPAFVAESTVVLPEPSEIRTDEPPAAPPEAATEAATEVTSTTAAVSGFVVPNGEKLAECKFEYGYSEEGPFESTPCSPLPGEGHKRVHVSAQLSGLIAGSNVFFRIDAKSDNRAPAPSTRSRRCRAAPAAQRPNPLCLPKRPTVNCPSKRAAAPAGSRIGTLRGRHRRAGPRARQRRLFPGLPQRRLHLHEVQYKDCELGGAKTLWWDDPATGWEPITEPTAVYNESTHCITVTATANSRPSVSQLSDPRHVGGRDGHRGIRQMRAHQARALRRRRLHERKVQGKGRCQELQGQVRMAGASRSAATRRSTAATATAVARRSKKRRASRRASTKPARARSTELRRLSHRSKRLGAAGVECSGSSSTGTLRAPNEASAADHHLHRLHERIRPMQKPGPDGWGDRHGTARKLHLRRILQVLHRPRREPDHELQLRPREAHAERCRRWTADRLHQLLHHHQ